MPDCVFILPSAERSKRNMQNFAECGERYFVRALLPLQIEDGGELKIGVWVEVAFDDFRNLHSVFWDDEEAYMAMSILGRIENTFRVLGENACGTLVHLAARTPDQCLFVRDSEGPWLSSILKEHFAVESLPDLKFEFHSSARQG